MQNKLSIKSISYEKIAYFFIILHVIVWTLLPAILRYSLPMDAVEGYVWGQNLQFGYDRNPWMNAWLTALAVQIGGSMMVYLFSQISVATCFICVWKLGKKILNPLYALIAMLLLEGIQYYTLAAVDFNDNVLEIGLWALTVFYFYNACKNQKLLDWLLTGAVAGLAMMTKYYSALLLFSLFIFLIINQDARKNLLKSSFYFGLLMFLLIILPHIFWLINNNFITVNYALIRVSDLVKDTVFHFAYIQLLAFTLPLLLFISLFIGKKDKILTTPCQVNKFDHTFLLTIALGPYLMTLLVATIFNLSLHTLWGTPLLSWWPLLLLTYIQPQITLARLQRFLIGILLVFIIIAAGYSYNILYNGYGSSANYPAQDITCYIEHEWQKNHSTKIKYVVGDRYIAGNFAYFAKDHPTPIITDDQHPLPSIFQPGTLFIWRDQPSFALPKNFKVYTQDFSWKRDENKTPIKINFAY